MSTTLTPFQNQVTVVPLQINILLLLVNDVYISQIVRFFNRFLDLVKKSLFDLIPLETIKSLKIKVDISVSTVSLLLNYRRCGINNILA